MLDPKKEQVSSSSSPSSSSSGIPTTGAAGVKIFQTKQGYTLLICNGYRYVELWRVRSGTGRVLGGLEVVLGGSLHILVISRTTLSTESILPTAIAP